MGSCPSGVCMVNGAHPKSLARSLLLLSSLRKGVAVRKVSICLALLGLVVIAHAETRVHTVPYHQTFILSEEFDVTPGKVAIDGDFAIVIGDHPGGRAAYLYQRASTGHWSARATLLAVQTSTPAGDDDLVMANGVAALRIGEILRIFERSGSTYLESETAGVPRAAPGLAISGGRILAARRGCNYDADVHEKSQSSGVWRITGRISGAAGECTDHGAALDLDGDVALIRNSPSEIREYRRSSDGQWLHVASITPPAGADFTLGAPTLSGNVAFVSEGRYFERVGTTWTFRGRVRPLDSARGTGVSRADYRGGLLITRSITNAYRAEAFPYLYLRNPDGGFDHVAVLGSPGGADYVDVSGTRAVISSVGLFGSHYLTFLELPTPLRAPPAIANDFEARDVSGWQQESGSQFGLASTTRGIVYRQSSLVAKSTALMSASDWPNAQSIEADVTPTAIDGSNRWVGLVLRYVDANNHYYITLRSSHRLLIQRMVAGSFSTLAEANVTFALNRTYHLKFIANGSDLSVYLDGNFVASAQDSALSHGRAGLQTYKARADYDNVYVGSTAPFTLADDEFDDFQDGGDEFESTGGNWTYVDQAGTPDIAWGQTSTSGDARAVIGTPTGDQVVEALARADAFGSSTAGWFGMLARWVDSRTYYYLAIRSVGRLDIRKRVNGVVTVLRSVPFDATPGRYHRLKFVVVGNELHAYVDDRFVAGALDDDIARGRYGLATSNAAARYQYLHVEQP
jgi:hypothetical protein